MEHIPDEELDDVLYYAGQLHDAFCRKEHAGSWGCQVHLALYRLCRMPNRSLWTRYGSLKNWVTCALRMREIYPYPSEAIEHVRAHMPAGFNPLMYMANGRLVDA